jgi:hypothetical protein
MPPKSTRPGSVTFVAIVLIILGSLSLLGGVLQIPQLVVALSVEPAARAPGQPPDEAAIHRFLAKEVPGYYAVTLVTAALSCAFGLAQLLVGIALMKLKPGARAWAIWIILAKLLFAFAGNAYQGFVVAPATKGFLAENIFPPGQQAPFDIGAFMGAFLLVVLVGSMVFQIAIALTLILVLMSATAKKAFSGVVEPQPDDGEEKEERRRSRHEDYDDDDDRPPDTGITDRS